MAEKYLVALKPWLSGRPGSDGECRAFCPNCEDPKTSKSPSASFNFKSEQWICFSCGKAGSFRSLLRLVNTVGESPARKVKEAENVTPIKGRPLPTAKQLRLWHKALMRRPENKRKMNVDRGMSDESLKKFLIGYDGQRYTIPIYDEHGELVNVRRYKPNAREHKDKMQSWGVGHGTARIDGLDTLEKYDEVLLCEGEMDRRIALQHGLPAVAHTGGAATFKPEWAEHFKGKVVYIAYDEDVSGDEGALKVTRILREVALRIYRVNLGTGIKGGDVTDFFVAGRTKTDMAKAMKDATPLFMGKSTHIVPTKGKPVSIQESMTVTRREPVELTVMVSGKMDPPYTAPRKIVGTCDMSAGAKCNLCPFAITNGERKVEFDPDDERILKFIGQSEARQQELMAKFTEARCRSHVQFDIDEAWDIEEMWVLPSLDFRTDEVEDPVGRLVYNVGTYRTPTNQPARIVGMHRTDHRDSRGTFHGWDLQPVQTDLDTFAMNPEIMKKLSVFRPTDGQKPLDKCKEIADDLMANVTHIYGRPMLHVGMDLTWHSLTGFVFEGKPVTKGWLECLVLGDTRTGKSETATALSRHYSAGIVKPLEGASLAGLVGGAQQASNKAWMVTWGLIPLNDRRLVVLDEMSGLFKNGNRDSKGIIEEMSSIRSEGKAQISKIASGETSARTRLIWVSNPLDPTPLADSADGALFALQKLVRQPEDIARFDYVMAASSKDVPSSTINSTKHKRVKHRYTADLCHQLVMWAWSRRTDQVQFLKGVEEFIYAAAEDLGSRYDPDPPLIQIANARIKVARLACAIAARTFSTDRSGEMLVVKRTHVRAAVEFLDEIYGDPAMGYKKYSEIQAEDKRRAEKAKVLARKYIKNDPRIIDVLNAIGGGEFRQRDFEEFGGLDRDEVKVLTQKLLEWRMIRRKGKGYMVMQTALVELLRELEAEGG